MLIAVAALHLLLMGVWSLLPTAPGGRPSAMARPAARQQVVTLRPLGDWPPPHHMPATAADRAYTGEAAATPNAPAAASASDPVLQAATEAVPPPAAAAGPVGEGDEYLPRSALTRGPEPTTEVLLTYPESAPEGRWQGVLTLFIDERGAVQRVRMESSEEQLPPPFREAARQAFLTARFTPGEWQGQPVRSRIRIAVEFEAGTSVGTSVGPSADPPTAPPTATPAGHSGALR